MILVSACRRKSGKTRSSTAKAATSRNDSKKVRSPSCGKGKVYDGTFFGKLAEGNGKPTEPFLENGIEVITE